MDTLDSARDPAPPMRECGSCSLCCKLLVIEPLNKPLGGWCKHCAVGTGCRVYETRPAECRDFLCGFLTLRELDESWRPSTSKLVICFDQGDTKTMFVHVDPARADAWTRAPYYPKLKEWSRRAVAGRGQVIVKIGRRAIVILPDKDVDLGPVGDDEMIATQECRSAHGIELNAIKLKRTDPRAALVIPPQQREGIAFG
ncbi:hypothetical protein [Bradyrhizobium sp. WSM3983]|uniref:hypothetical protein n=1 Tax=Bradyrhizobium sp. WSM3983 TaxID=1038867 RepID=UPI0012EC9A04|nr:hypothetical protein [Bradyrhizobium sp. WSM3983]